VKLANIHMKRVDGVGEAWYWMRRERSGLGAQPVVQPPPP
jgi:hypothetical protein